MHIFVPVVKHGPVLYVAAEGGGAFQYRIQAWATEHSVDLTTVPFHSIVSPINLLDGTFQQELQAIVTDVQPILIIVDTLHRATPGAEESSSQDLGVVVNFATRLQALSPCAVMFPTTHREE
jgi:hypothetical protein